MTKQLQGFFFKDFPNTHIPEILEEIYLRKIYEPYVSGKTDMTIVDIGSNIGLSVFYFSEFAKKVYAIEPAKEHQETLQTMLDYNKIQNIQLLSYAVSNKNGTTKFYHNPNTTAHSLSLVNDKENFEEVRTVTFDIFMEENKLKHIDLLKLDPEGEEGNIITSEGFKKYADNISVIVGEWHQWGNMEKQQFANVFIDLGFHFRWLPGMRASVYTAVRL